MELYSGRYLGIRRFLQNTCYEFKSTETYVLSLNFRRLCWVASCTTIRWSDIHVVFALLNPRVIHTLENVLLIFSPSSTFFLMPLSNKQSICAACGELTHTDAHPGPRSACPNACKNVCDDGLPCGMLGSSRPSKHRTGCVFHVPPSTGVDDEELEGSDGDSEKSYTQFTPNRPSATGTAATRGGVPQIYTSTASSPVHPPSSGPIDVQTLVNDEIRKHIISFNSTYSKHIARLENEMHEKDFEAQQRIAFLEDSNAILRKSVTSGSSSLPSVKESEPFHDEERAKFPRRPNWRTVAHCEDDQLPNRAVHAFRVKDFASPEIASLYKAFTPAAQLELDTLYTFQSFFHDINAELKVICRNPVASGSVQDVRLQKLLHWLRDLQALLDNRYSEIIASKFSPVVSKVERRQAQNERFALSFPDKAYGQRLIAASNEMAKAELQYAIKSSGRELANQNRTYGSGFFDYGVSSGASRRSASSRSPERIRTTVPSREGTPTRTASRGRSTERGTPHQGGSRFTNNTYRGRSSSADTQHPRAAFQPQRQSTSPGGHNINNTTSTPSNSARA